MRSQSSFDRFAAFRDYGLAVVLVAAAFVTRQALGSVLGSRLPFQFFYFPVLISAWVGGFGPAICAFALGFLVGDWFFVETRGSLAINAVEHRIASVAYVGVSLAFAVFGNLIRVKERRLQGLAHEANRRKDLLAVTLASIGDAVVVTNEEGQISSLNSEAERMSGWKSAHAAGALLTEVFCVDDARSQTPVPFARLREMTPAKAISEDFVLRSKTRSPLWVNLSAAVIRGTGAEPCGFVFVFRDVTERKRASDSLHESQQRLELALGAGRMGVWEWTVATGDVVVSPAVEAMLGLRAGEFGGRFSDYKRYIHPDDVQAVLAGLQRALDTQSECHSLYRVRGRDGVERWLEAFGRVDLEADTQLQKLHGICIDVTERKNRELELRRRVDELDTLLEILPVGVWIGNRDCSQIRGNRAAYAIFGFRPGSNASVTTANPEVPQGIRIRVDGVEVSPQDAPMQRVARTGEPWHHFEHDVVFPDGTIKSVYGSCAPVFDEQGKVRQVIAAYADVTARKNTERSRMAALSSPHPPNGYREAERPAVIINSR